MRRLLFPLLLAFVPAAWAQPVTTISGESKQLCRLWDGTDVALVDGSGNQMVAGTLTCNAGSGTFTVSGTVTANQGGTWTVLPGNTANTTAWLVTGTGGTFPITAASLPLPTGAATSAKQDEATSVLDSIETNTGATAAQLPAALDGSGYLKVHEQGTATVTGPVTDTQLRATPVPVSGTVTVTDGAGALNTIVDSGTITTVTTVTNPVKIGDGSDTALVSGSGSLQVTCDNCGGSTFADDDAFTGGSSSILPIGALYDTTPPAITDGSAGIPRMNSSRALLVDGSGVTQPVSGTFWQATQPVSGTVAVSGTVTVGDGAGALNVIVDSATLGTVTVGGAAADGAAVSGNPVRVASKDGSGNTQDILSGTDGRLDVNLGQVAGATVATGNGTAAGSVRVSVASDSTGSLIATSATAANFNNRPDTSGATGAAPPARADYVGGLASGATGGFLTGFAVCDTFVNVNVSTATTTALVTGVSGRNVRICSLSLVTAAANNVALISGTGATCGTGTTGMNGGTTSASGWNFAANGGITQGSGLGAINQTNATGDSVCVITSAATQLSGRISYTIY